MITSPEQKASTRPSVRAVLTDPVLLLAHGLGSGLAPKAPGTFGTFAALLPWYFMAQWPLLIYGIVVVLSALAGVWLCGEAQKRMGVASDADPGSIVWDEWVGVWIALAGVPLLGVPLNDMALAWPWVVTAVLLFRVFDILKPGPIGWLDQHVHGGWGIMLDDVAAGLAAVFALIGLHWLLGLL
jgi:phosphatidylglycerophosphatase A